MRTKSLFALPMIAVFILSGISLAHAQTASVSYEFNQTLTVGSAGADVIALQQLLINKGFLTSVSTPTGYFGTGTQNALAKFQAANGISPASGYGGAKTRAFLNTINVSLSAGQSTSSAINQVSQNSVQFNSPPPVATTTPPPNTTLCNGSYYPNCSAGYNFVCPAIGGAYCRISQQQQAVNDQAAQEATLQQQQAQAQQEQVQAAAAQQQKTNQINALTSSYNTQYNALQQQIINIKSKYYTDLANIENSRTNLAEAQGEEQNLLNQDNSEISQIQLQEQQLYLNYETQVQAPQ